MGLEPVRLCFEGEHPVVSYRLIFYRHGVFCRPDALVGSRQVVLKTKWQMSTMPSHALQPGKDSGGGERHRPGDTHREHQALSP